jgi:hypothetical protein
MIESSVRDWYDVLLKPDHLDEPVTPVVRL